MFGNSNNRKLTLYICCTIDGYISTHDDDISFLTRVERAGEDYGYAAFMETIDTVIIGRKTYDKVLEMLGSFPHAKDKTCYVVSNSRTGEHDGITYYHGTAKTLLQQIRSSNGLNIFCDGGAEVVNWLMKDQLIDELMLFVCPVLLGEGRKLFQEGFPITEATLKTTKTYPSGLVLLHYQLSNQLERK